MPRSPRLAIAALAVTGSAAAAVALVAPAPAPAATKTVTVGDNFFVRSSGTPALTVARGTTVRWVWRGSAPHNVTVMRGPQRFRSKTQRRGSFSKRLSRPGTYTIVCTVHGAGDQSMRLRVR